MAQSLDEALWFRKPAHPSPSRRRSALFPLLPETRKPLFAGPRNHPSFSEPVLRRMPSRANPSPGRSPQVLLLTLRRLHRGARKRCPLLLPLPRLRLPCRRTSNPFPVPAAPLLWHRRCHLRTRSSAIPEDCQRRAVAIPRQFSLALERWKLLQVPARSQLWGIPGRAPSDSCLEDRGPHSFAEQSFPLRESVLLAL